MGEEIQKETGKKGTRWKAGKTSVSELTLDEKKAMLGLIPTEEEKELMNKKLKKKETD